MKVALDTTNILGRGAVKDRQSAVGHRPAGAALAQLRGISVGLGKEPGICAVPRFQHKGQAAIDWADRQARAALLALEDADRVLELSRQAQGALAEDALSDSRLWPSELGQLLLQDVAGLKAERT